MIRLPSWDALRKTRGELYGLAILSVIVFHYFDGVASTGAAAGEALFASATAYNTLVGSMGVEVFVFLSGFGIYHSLSNNPPLGAFYLRRIRRVLLPYLIIGAMFWGFKDLVLMHLPVECFLRDYAFVSFWLEGVRTVWYVPFILLMYLVSPLVWRMLKAGCPSLVLAVAWTAGCMAAQTVVPDFYAHTEIALMRVPLFFLGMGCGKLAKKDSRVPTPILVALPVFALLKLYSEVAHSPYIRIANGLYACFLMAAYVFVHEAVQRRFEPSSRVGSVLRTCDSFLRRVGSVSYELYLSHVLLRNIGFTLGANLTLPLCYLGCIAVSVPVALALAQLQRKKPTKRHLRLDMQN